MAKRLVEGIYVQRGEPKPDYALIITKDEEALLYLDTSSQNWEDQIRPAPIDEKDQGHIAEMYELANSEQIRSVRSSLQEQYSALETKLTLLEKYSQR